MFDWEYGLTYVFDGEYDFTYVFDWEYGLKCLTGSID